MHVKRFYVEIGAQSYRDLVIIIIRVVRQTLNKNFVSFDPKVRTSGPCGLTAYSGMFVIRDFNTYYYIKHFCRKSIINYNYNLYYK